MLQTMNIWGTAMWMIFFMTVFLPKKGSGYIIGTYEDYLKLHPNEKYSMPIIQKPNKKFYIWNGRNFFTLIF